MLPTGKIPIKMKGYGTERHITNSYRRITVKTRRNMLCSQERKLNDEVKEVVEGGSAMLDLFTPQLRPYCNHAIAHHQ